MKANRQTIATLAACGLLALGCYTYVFIVPVKKRPPATAHLERAIVSLFRFHLNGTDLSGMDLNGIDLRLIKVPHIFLTVFMDLPLRAE